MTQSSGHETLHEYYREQQVLPTHGAFRGSDDLATHEELRLRLFTDKLQLPPRLFAGAKLLEYGPDSGENSLVFARWGASCTLIEPNPKAHPAIKEYFARFGLRDRLAALEAADIAQYARREGTLERFDFIDAEGFIYTVKPASLWIDLFARQISDGGMAILFYYERFGSFFELLSKVMHTWFRRRSGAGATEAAQAVFGAKWASIPHKRTIESWAMDVLENPFVRLDYFYDPVQLCREMQARGFSHYSSWPPYRNGLEAHWFKKSLPAAERLAAQADFIRRSSLSHMFGRTLFLVHELPRLQQALSSLVRDIDALIDRFDDDIARQCITALSIVESAVQSDAVYGDTDDKEFALRALRSAQSVLSLLVGGRSEELISFCNADEAFIRTWGMPSHFAVFRFESGN